MKDNDEKVISDDDIFQYIFDEGNKQPVSDRTSVNRTAERKKDRSIFNEMDEFEKNRRTENRAYREHSATYIDDGRRSRSYGRSSSSGRRHGKRRYDRSKEGIIPFELRENPWFFGSIIFFPVALMYLEMVFHVFMEGGLSGVGKYAYIVVLLLLEAATLISFTKLVPDEIRRFVWMGIGGMTLLMIVISFVTGALNVYSFIYVVMSIPIGLLLSIFTLLFNKIANMVIACGLTLGMCVLFGAEVVLRDIFSNYTQLFSIMNLAGQVTDTNYLLVALESIMDNLFTILFILFPVVFMAFIGRVVFEFRRRQLTFTGVLAGCVAATWIFAVLFLNMPFGVGTGTYTPKQLYKMDTEVAEQVDKLGVITMLRLDVKHTLFGTPERELDDVFNSRPTVPTGNGGTTVPGESTEESTTEDPVDRSPNIMQIDFATLIEKTKNDDIEWMHKFVSQTNEDGTYIWATNKNEYTGMFKDYNVIFITAEGFSKYVVIPELMPTLTRLSKEGFVFENFYSALHYTSTSGGEFQNLTGMYPKNGNPVSMTESGKKGTNMYFSLGNMLNRKNYTSIGYHNNTNMYGRDKSHPNLGYNWIYGGNGFEMEKREGSNKTLWPQSDLYMMEQTMDDYMQSTTPFNIYYLTVSGHVQYNFSGNAMSIKNKDAVKDLPYSETTQAYIACTLELEKALAKLVETLESTGLDKKTLLVLAPDHVPYFNIDSLEELAGQSFGGEQLDYLKESDVDFDVYKNMLIMWSGSMEEPIKVDKVCCQVDILPTILNLLGLEYDSRLIVGKDILSTTEGLVIFTSQSWISDLGEYNSFTKKFTLAEGLDKSVYTEEYIESYVKYMKKAVRNKLNASVIFVEDDYYDAVFG